MKTSSKSPPAGVRIRPVGRSSGRSSANGSGISAWNADSTSLPRPCGRLNSLLLLLANLRQSASLRQPVNLPQSANLPQPWCMALLTGHEALASAPPIASPSPLPQPLPVLPHAPVLWEDWPRCQIRRHWLNVIRSETVVVMKASPTEEPTLVTSEPVMTRTQQAHLRLSRNARL